MVFVNNGYDRNSRKKTFFKTLFYTGPTVSLFLSRRPGLAHQYVLQNYCELLMWGACGCAVPQGHTLVWLHVTIEDIRLQGTEMRALAGSRRAGQCQSACSDGIQGQPDFGDLQGLSQS